MTNTTSTNKNSSITSDVLFQKVGTTWYIFAEVNNEFVYSAMPEGMDPRETKLELFNVIEEHITKIAQLPKYRQSEAA